jgi:hypothetical protein
LVGSVVVVVVVGPQAPPHASQQLGALEAHPPFAVQAPESVILHVRSLGAGRQQATVPGLPQVERAAHRCTALRQRGGKVWAWMRSRATPAAHAT